MIHKKGKEEGEGKVGKGRNGKAGRNRIREGWKRVKRRRNKEGKRKMERVGRRMKNRNEGKTEFRKGCEEMSGRRKLLRKSS